MLEHCGLKLKVIEEIIELAKEHELKRVILFGSRARGDFRRRSDIDLAVSGGNAVKFSLDVEDKVNTLSKSSEDADLYRSAMNRDKFRKFLGQVEFSLHLTP